MAEPLTPEWWVQRLHKRIIDQQAACRRYDDYYGGNHPVPWLAPQARDEFRRLLELSKSNYMGLVPDATAERCHVEGFSLGGDEPDAETWRIWQANNLDADSDEAILDALVRGRSFFLVAPNPDDEATPHVWVEDATQVAVEYEPGSNLRRRAAGLKVWVDDWTGDLNATLYLPGGLYKFRTKAPRDGVVLTPSSVQWEQRDVPGEAWPAPNPLGVVPLVELPNMRRRGISEIHDVIPIQDRVNKTLADRMMSQDFGAFPQKWATGYPEEREDGTPTEPINIGRDRMVTSDVAETRFGQWDAAPLDPFSNAKREDVKDIASRTRTPAQYLLGEMSNVNGETLKAAESGLVAKARSRMRLYGESLEEVMRLARRAAGLSGDGSGMETKWRNPEFRTEGELADATVKKHQAGLITRRQAQEDLGYSPQQITRMEADFAREASDPLIANLLRPMAEPEPAA